MYRDEAQKWCEDLDEICGDLFGERLQDPSSLLSIYRFKESSEDMVEEAPDLMVCIWYDSFFVVLLVFEIPSHGEEERNIGEYVR